MEYISALSVTVGEGNVKKKICFTDQKTQCMLSQICFIDIVFQLALLLINYSNKIENMLDFKKKSGHMCVPFKMHL